MDIESIREFLLLADTGNYEETAFTLFTTQSTISKHIIAMENQLGGNPLFNRGRGSTYLTPFGQKFYLYASKIVDLYDEFVNITTSISKDSRTIHIGYAAGMDPYGFFDMIKEFCRDHPDLRVFLEDESIATKLRMGDVDIAILYENLDTFDRDSILLYQDRLVPIVNASHKLAKETNINIRQLKNEPFIMPSPRLYLHKQCQSFCREHGFIPKVVHSVEGSLGYMITSFVAQDLGVALIPERAARFWANDSYVILEPDSDHLLNICIQYQKTHILSEAEECFVSYMKDKSRFLESYFKGANDGY